MRAGPKAASAWRFEAREEPASVTAHYGFSKRAHLCKTDDISSVFDFRWRQSGAYLTVLAKPNDKLLPRLAVMVSRRVSPLAVRRNYMRRLVREVFRHRQHDIGAFDIVVRVTRPFMQTRAAVVRDELTTHFVRLSQSQCQKFSSS
jgi:ribonuclease P protein component